MKVKARRRTKQSAQSVWEALSNHEGMGTWGPGIAVTMERAGEDDPRGVGAIRRVKGMGPVIREEITGFEPHRRLSYRALSGLPLSDYQGEVLVASRSRGSVVSWELSTTSRSSLARVPLWVMSRIFLAALLRAAARHNAKGGRS